MRDKSNENRAIKTLANKNTFNNKRKQLTLDEMLNEIGLNGINTEKKEKKNKRKQRDDRQW